MKGRDPDTPQEDEAGAGSISGDDGMNKFKKGDRVMASWSGRREFRFRSLLPYRGVVVSHPQGNSLVRVLRDGTKTPQTYHIDFWMHEDRDRRDMELESQRRVTIDETNSEKR